MISLHDVSKVYRGSGSSTAALDGVTLDVGAGGFTVVTGPSGSGKSTLLGVVAGLCRVTGGTVEVGGKDLTLLPEHFVTLHRRKMIGFVFQEFNLLRGFSARENVELAQMAARVPRGERRDRIDALLGRLGLAKRAEEDVRRLSGGERQRVAVARALANDPPILLADEPTSQIDKGSARAVKEAFRDLHGRGTTIVVSSHDGGFAEGLEGAVRIALDGGRVAS